jgi:uncharacterized protein YabN with tetrapyrrole methylase and pyrophosphatase domain
MGSLTIVGTGIRSVAQVTLEAKAHMQQADKLLYLVTDPVTRDWICGLNETAESLHDCYRDEEPRLRAYARMTERIAAWVRKDLNVCVAFYGHPGVFVKPSHDAILQARQEGHRAEMLPGVSAEDCMFADLGFDPAVGGCQSYEATDFLTRKPRFDTASHLILWQVSVIAEGKFSSKGNYRKDGLAFLAEALLEHYPPEHEVFLYTAALYSVCKPEIQRVPLSGLAKLSLSPTATLYVPPFGQRLADRAMVERLGMEAAS